MALCVALALLVIPTGSVAHAADNPDGTIYYPTNTSDGKFGVIAMTSSSTLGPRWDTPQACPTTGCNST